MTTVRQIKTDLDRAAAASRAGDEVTCARIAIICQREAARSRSRHAHDLEFRAHALAALALYRARLRGIGTQAERSEIGRIAAESQYRFRR
ncbi:MAG: hypothetical protein ACK5QX_11340 [bacterium]|jgi:hypothetical protein